VKAPPIPRRVRRLVPQLAETMREDRRLWAGDYVSDRAHQQYRAALAVLDAILGPEAVQPECCWGYDPKTKRCRCKLHRAIEDLRALTRRSSTRRPRSPR
jgi:hypothetical protein